MPKFFGDMKKVQELSLLVFLLTVFGIGYSIIAVQSHNHFETFGWDLGYFDQLIWKVSRGIYPYSTLSHVNLLAGHFAPVLILFAPLYILWSDPRMLLIAQSFLMVFAALPLYFLSKLKTKSVFFSFSVVISYLLFQGTQWSILNEFHEATIAPLFIILLFWSLEKKNRGLLILSSLGLLATKEEMALLLSSIAVPVFYYFRNKKLGIIMGLIPLIIFFFLVLFLMPKLSESGVFYQQRLSSDTTTPVEFIAKLVSDPSYIITSFTTPPGKISVFIISLLSFGLLPVFAPWTILIPLWEQFFMRFIYTGPQFTFWQNVNHHAAPSAILLSIASIYGASVLIKSNKIKYISYSVMACILIISTFFQDFMLKNPIHSLFKTGLYSQLPWMDDNNEVLKRIPKDVSVAAQNNLFPHLSQRKEIFLLPELGDAEYIIFDFSGGPNKYSPSDRDALEKLSASLLERHQYRIQLKKGETVLLQRN